MKRRIFLIAAGLAVALMSAAAPSALAASTAPHSTAAPAAHSAASSGTTICAHTHPAYCADVRGNINKAGTKIWLYPHGADDHWIVVLNPQGCSVITIPCYFIKDAQNTSLCMAATGTGGAPIELETCNDSGSWYNEGNYILGNGRFGEAGTLDTQAIGTHDYLYALAGGKYRQFTVYGWN
jgi:hypothetical protein